VLDNNAPQMETSSDAGAVNEQSRIWRFLLHPLRRTVSSNLSTFPTGSILNETGQSKGS
jgi:hypothetical protein